MTGEEAWARSLRAEIKVWRFVNRWHARVETERVDWQLLAERSIVR